jgi:CRISPR/Cas system-associated endoribonuclease Cas2
VVQDECPRLFTPLLTVFETGSFKKMKKVDFKILTMSVALLVAGENLAQVIKQVSSKAHLRWNVSAPKDHISLRKKGNHLFIKTLNNKLYESLKDDLSKLELNKAYITNVTYKEPDERNNVPSIDVELASDSVEHFTFYRDREKQYIVDFWVDADESTKIEKNLVKAKPVKQLKKKKKINILKRKTAIKPIVKQVLKKPVDTRYRDFRYGASFIWDYPAMAPKLKNVINLDVKTAEFFYPIKNRTYDKNEQEAHLQLTINLYRKKKYGLMYKSIKLFKTKFGEDHSFDINEYLTANAILRENLKKGNSEPVKTAISMYQSIIAKSDNYELRKGLYRYLISYYMNKNEYVKSLELTKRYYVDSKENFDYEESNWAAEGILNNLSKLNQIDKVRGLLKDKTIVKLLPKQLMIAYEIYTQLNLGNTEKVIQIYKNNKRSLIAPVHKTIIYNVAEAYFRNAQYNKAIKLYDTFLKNYSYDTHSNQSRLRIALAYDLLDKNVNEVQELYKNAINRIQDSTIAYEARIRYVAHKSVRLKKINETDREVRIFLENKKKVKLTKELKQLRWLTRLRTLIVDKEYKRALAYLNALPLKSMKPTIKRVYEADGAEIVYGLISKLYKDAEYSRVITAWEVYKNRYVDKVASDPTMNFIVGRSYIKMGLYDGFDTVYKKFSENKQKVRRTFPIWYKRAKTESPDFLLAELQVIRNINLKNWSLAKRQVNNLEKINSNYRKNNYYKGMIAYNTKKIKPAIKSFEKFLASEGEVASFDDREVADMIFAYADSLYQNNEYEKYKSIADAVLSDTKKYSPTNMYVRGVRERIAYNLIEILAGDNNDSSSLLVEAKVKKFKKEYTDSIYLGRLNYLLALSLIENDKNEEGKEILSSLLKDSKTSDYLKELVRTEISLMKIKQKTL